MSTESEVFLGLIREKLKRLEDVHRLETSNSVLAGDPGTAVVGLEKQINYINEELWKRRRILAEMRKAIRENDKDIVFDLACKLTGLSDEECHRTNPGIN